MDTPKDIDSLRVKLRTFGDVPDTSNAFSDFECSDLGFACESASWDKQYLQLITKPYGWAGLDWGLDVKAWRQFSKNEPLEIFDEPLWAHARDFGPDNDDTVIRDNYGRVEYSAFVGFRGDVPANVPYRLQIGLMLRKWGLVRLYEDGRKGALRLDVKWALPEIPFLDDIPILRTLVQPTHTILHLRYFNGYGDTLRRYAQEAETVRDRTLAP